MANLEAEPTGWASWNVSITSHGAPITELKISTWKSRGAFELDGQSFTIEPKGFWGHNAELRRQGTVIARAQKPGALARRWTISSAGHRLTLESRSWRGREYALRLGNQEAGHISRKGMTGRRIFLHFPDNVPEVLQIFLTYLVPYSVSTYSSVRSIQAHATQQP